MRAGARALIAALAIAAEGVRAGPPLLADDPHTIGPGKTEAILAISGLGDRDTQILSAPILDLTLGVIEGVDLTLVMSADHTFESGHEPDTDGAGSIGVKWQPVASERWNASFSPALTLTPSSIADEAVVVLPVELEYDWARFYAGVNAGYAIDSDGPDLLFGALHGGFAASDSLTLLAELWGGALGADHEEAAGFNLGFDWMTPLGPHLLAAAGPGYSWRDDGRARWYAYLGLQWDSTLWSGD